MRFGRVVHFTLGSFKPWIWYTSWVINQVRHSISMHLQLASASASLSVCFQLAGYKLGLQPTALLEITHTKLIIVSRTCLHKYPARAAQAANYKSNVVTWSPVWVPAAFEPLRLVPQVPQWVAFRERLPPTPTGLRAGDTWGEVAARNVLLPLPPLLVVLLIYFILWECASC